MTIRVVLLDDRAIVRTGLAAIRGAWRTRPPLRIIDVKGRAVAV